MIASIFRAGFTVVERQFSRSFDEMVQEIAPDLVVAIVAATRPADLSVLRYVTACAGGIPVIALTEEHEASAAIQALDAGAIAAHALSAAPDLLTAQVAAVQRAFVSASPAIDVSQVVTVADIAIDYGRRTVTRAGSRILLTKTEFDILRLLVDNAGRVLTPTEIAAGVGQIASSKAQARGMVKVHVSHLRQKLGWTSADDPVGTVRGVGYIVEVAGPTRASGQAGMGGQLLALA